jgi:putative phosphoesterase
VRVALVSDLHANAIALDAVLADIADASVDRVVCLGDVATLGPSPAAVVERLRGLRCLCIRGNHDDFLLRPELVRQYTETPIVVAAIEWAGQRLGAADREFLATFADSARVPLEGGLELLVYHGSPRSNTEDILATTPPADLDRLIDGHAAPLMAGGHTHIQMLRKHRGVLLVNPGSVGLPFAEHAAGRSPALLPHAEYAIVDGRRDGDVRVELRRITMDPVALAETADASDNPICIYQAQQFRKAAAARP